MTASRHLPSVVSHSNHDTISLAVLTASGSMATGTSTNGLSFKIPGRVGDAAVPGAGNYGLAGVGACGATGDGDFSACFACSHYYVTIMTRILTHLRQ